MNILQYLAGWSRKSKDVSPAVRQGATEAIRDTLACMIAGAGDPVVGMVRQAYRTSLSAGVSTAIGGGTDSPGVAALINATAAHTLDYDDTFRPLMGHASAVLVPALLATGRPRTRRWQAPTGKLSGRATGAGRYRRGGESKSLCRRLARDVDGGRHRRRLAAGAE